jgi:hypothetical protein
MLTMSSCRSTLQVRKTCKLFLVQCCTLTPVRIIWSRNMTWTPSIPHHIIPLSEIESFVKDNRNIGKELTLLSRSNYEEMCGECTIANLIHLVFPSQCCRLRFSRNPWSPCHEPKVRHPCLYLMRVFSQSSGYFLQNWWKPGYRCAYKTKTLNRASYSEVTGDEAKTIQSRVCQHLKFLVQLRWQQQTEADLRKGKENERYSAVTPDNISCSSELNLHVFALTLSSLRLSTTRGLPPSMKPFAFYLQADSNSFQSSSAHDEVRMKRQFCRTHGAAKPQRGCNRF